MIKKCCLRIVSLDIADIISFAINYCKNEYDKVSNPTMKCSKSPLQTIENKYVVYCQGYMKMKL